MNYLAHLHLSGPDPDCRTGNLMGDFVRGRLYASRLEALPPGYGQGLRLHRFIDHFTDTHPVAARSRHRLSQAGLRRVSGIVVDVGYDFILARHFSTYAGEPLPAFAARAYAELSGRLPTLPPPMQAMVQALVAHDWLNGYATRQGLLATLAGMARRRPWAAALPGGGSIFLDQLPAFEADFSIFYPELMAASAAFIHHAADV